MKFGKRVSAVVLVLCILLLLSGCAGKPKKPTAEDAEKYVKAVLDVMCTGDYDRSVNLTDADELETMVEDTVDEALDTLVLQMNLSDDVIADFRDVLLSMFSKARYTVGRATPVEDGFDVPVTMEPIVFGEEVEAAVNEGVAELMSDPNVANMTEEEITNSLMRYAVNALKADLEDPHYGESTEVVVRYKELQDGVWGVDEADGAKLGEAMFRTS